VSVRTIAGIDIGSTKITSMIAQMDGEHIISVFGHGTVPARGIQRGMVVNLEDATRAVRASITKAEQMAGYRIGSAYVSITGKHISTFTRRGAVAMSREFDGRVNEDDILRAVETAQAEPLSQQVELLHVMPFRYTLDGNVVRDPIGMLGYRLEVDVHLVVCEVGAIQNLITVVQNAGVDIDDVVLQQLASAEAVLTDEDRQNGVVLVDIGTDTTGVAFVAEGNTWHTHVIPIGGHTITNDLILLFGINAAAAEQTKISDGDALALPTRASDTIVLEGQHPNEPVTISRQQFNDAIQARSDELIDFIIYEVSQCPYLGAYAAGIVLTGGGAQQRNLDALFYDRFNAPVRVGTTLDVEGMNDALDTPSYTTVLGLIRWGYRHGQSGKHNRDEGSMWVDTYERFKMWLREFLP
jgi:cell division protein FtsA